MTDWPPSELANTGSAKYNVRRPRKRIMETEHPVLSVTRLSWRFFVLTALMSILAPLLADCLQSFSVVRSGIRFYQAIFSLYLDSPGALYVFVVVRAIVTFLVLWFFARPGFRGRIVWLCFVVLWTIADFMLEPGVVK